MTPTEQGRFCNACAKEVIDFSSMTDAQVLSYFTNLTHEKICGRALPEQLDRTINLPVPPKKRLFWYWNYVVMFFMFFTKGNNANAQSCTKPATEMNPVKNTGNKEELLVMGGIKRPESHVVSGKVADTDGNPVSFASITVKGANTGVSADANGAYSIRVSSNTILFISGASYIQAEVPVGNQLIINTVLEKMKNVLTGEVLVVYTGGISFSNVDEYYGPLDKLNNVAVIRVKDEETGKVIPGASLIIEGGYSETAQTVNTDKKGMYKIKGIKRGDEYAIKVSVAGYEPNEFTIDEYDFINRKKEWEVLLRKQKSAFEKETVPPTQNLKADLQIHILGQTRIAPLSADSLYIIDGAIVPKSHADLLNPDDISDISRVEKAEATALFGPDASNGAVVITTRKAKEIKLKEVVVTSDFPRRRMGGMTGSITFIKQNSLLTEKITNIKTMLTDSIKIYPNPVQHNSEFSVQLKLKHPGNNYSFIIADAAGRILLQQRFNASAKDHIEKITADGRWAGGIYYVRVFDAQNQLISKAGFIVL